MPKNSSNLKAGIGNGTGTIPVAQPLLAHTDPDPQPTRGRRNTVNNVVVDDGLGIIRDPAAKVTDPTLDAIPAKARRSTSKVRWKTRRDGLEEIRIMTPVASVDNAAGGLNEALDGDASSMVSTRLLVP